MTTATAPRLKSVPDWRLVLFGAVFLALRLPLWLLPGPGRDEAAYHYWAHHPELSYSPLLQAAVRLCELGAAPGSVVCLRLPVIVTGVLVLVLNDRRLARAGAASTSRWLALVALALTPWQCFTGAILHPDGLLLAALLGFVLAAQSDHLWGLVLSAVAAVLAKPTGVICLPIAWWLVGRAPHLQKWTARVVLAATAAGLAAVMSPEMIGSIASFGRLAPGTAWWRGALSGGISILYAGGGVIFVLGAIGAKERWHQWREGAPDSAATSEARASLVLAAAFIAVFLAAALFHGQFKSNWVLPALVLLWPLRWSPGSSRLVNRRWLVVGLILSAAASVFQTAVLVRPGLIAALEQHLAANGSLPRWTTYSNQAGRREAVVSSSRRWSDHLLQYQDASAFAAAVQSGWQDSFDSDSRKPKPPISWIVGDDYGLLCQLHWYLGHPGTQLAIANDGIFKGTWDNLIRTRPRQPLLQICRHNGAKPLSSRLKSVTILPPVPHPVTGELLQPTVAIWNRPFAPE